MWIIYQLSRQESPITLMVISYKIYQIIYKLSPLWSSSNLSTQSHIENYQVITKHLTSTFQIAKFMSYKETQRAVIQEVTRHDTERSVDPGWGPGTETGKCK